MDIFIKKVKNLCGESTDVLIQRDMFLHSSLGRLKLRTINNENSQLIYYVRNNEFGPKQSIYSIVDIQHPNKFIDIMMKAGNGIDEIN